MARVVVGMDGSDASKRALRLAQEQARFRDVELEAIYVYEDDRGVEDRYVDLSKNFMGGAAQSTRTGPAEDRPTHAQQAKRRAHDKLSTYVKEALAGQEDARPKPHLVVLAGDEVVETIVDHIAGADLLVIGLRRRTPVGKLVLGSDARDILLQSPVPVLAVHADD